MPMANTMFCFTMLNVLRAIIMPSTIFMGLSFINTMSAASMAASLPTAPMAMPMSASLMTGASLMPSPTKAMGDRACSLRSASTNLTLSIGSSSAWNSSMFTFLAISLATSLRSPVSMIVFPTPEVFSLAMVSADCGFRLSETTICPI